MGGGIFIDSHGRTLNCLALYWLHRRIQKHYKNHPNNGFGGPMSIEEEYIDMDPLGCLPAFSLALRASGSGC